ncbi:hypothetical protein ACNKHQ_17395 [Shigella flexneri]
MSKGTTSQDAPFGTLLGYAPGGVAIYSSDYSSLDPQEYEDDASFRSYMDNEYMASKWRLCVGIVATSCLSTTDLSSPMWAWPTRSFRCAPAKVVNNDASRFQAFANGSAVRRSSALANLAKGGGLMRPATWRW